MPKSLHDYVKHRTRHGGFLLKLNDLIDWSKVSKVIDSHYQPSPDGLGGPAYPGLLLFKMLLIGIWYGGMSDEEIEEKSNHDLLVIRYLGLSIQDPIPDHAVLSQFRTKIIKSQVWDSLLDAINRQFTEKGVRVKPGYYKV